ncbi:MAG: GNAT family N-acetyltransferase [Rikenellaceae bacterium]
MIIRQRITSEKDTLFSFCWELYLSSFPEIERRDLDYHTQALTYTQFHFDAILYQGKAVGLISWWDFDNLRYIEHLATSSAVRGKGLGAQIITDFINEDSKDILLEVEHPTNELSTRRVGFYERLGFVLNDHRYFQPSYRQIDGEELPLLIMSYPHPISQERLQEFVDNELMVIHFGNKF